jgi:hypothetical protein
MSPTNRRCFKKWRQDTASSQTFEFFIDRIVHQFLNIVTQKRCTTQHQISTDRNSICRTAAFISLSYCSAVARTATGSRRELLSNIQAEILPQRWNNRRHWAYQRIQMAYKPGRPNLVVHSFTRRAEGSWNDA